MSPGSSMLMPPASTATSVAKPLPRTSGAMTPRATVTSITSPKTPSSKPHAWRPWKNALSKPLATMDAMSTLTCSQQFLEPADVLIEDRADEGQRRGLIAGPGADLAIGRRKQLVSVLFSTQPELTPIISRHRQAAV